MAIFAYDQYIESGWVGQKKSKNLHNLKKLNWNLLFFRYPNPFLQQPPPSPLETQLKSQLPGGLGHDPRLWHREDVSIFLRYCEREFDLEQIDLEKFQMNGKYFLLFIYYITPFII